VLSKDTAAGSHIEDGSRADTFQTKPDDLIDLKKTFSPNADAERLLLFLASPLPFFGGKS
jgi:hypothetical protein